MSSSNLQTAIAGPEWARGKEIKNRFGLGRTILYRLVREGKVTAIRIDERGVRLYNVESIRRLLKESLIPGKL